MQISLLLRKVLIRWDSLRHDQSKLAINKDSQLAMKKEKKLAAYWHRGNHEFFPCPLAAQNIESTTFRSE